MDILKVVSHLMAYPTRELIEHRADLADVVRDSTDIPPAMRQSLIDMMEEMAGRDLMDVQEEYGGLFDRGRSLSLLMFEHVHGESRDRGQAMVDLMANYEEAGFEISVRELPDYIPLYLEYLAQQPEIDARHGLDGVAHILGLMSARLQERQSPYHLLFDTLLIISGAEVDISELRKTAAAEERDDTMEALDQVWEEEAVRFGSGDNAATCEPQSNAGEVLAQQARKEQASPIHWVDANQQTAPVKH